MKRSSRAHNSLSPALLTLCLVFVSLFVLTLGHDANAVRISEEEVEGKAPPKIEPLKKKAVVPPKKPAVTKKPEVPDRREAKPVTPIPKAPVKKKPAIADREKIKPVAPTPKPPAKKRPTIADNDKAKPVSPPKEPAVTKKPPAKKEPEKKFVTIDFDNVDILLLIKFISEVTGKNFVIDQKVKGKVTIVSPTKISVDEAYKVFESVLEVHGFTTVPAGSIVKILPSVTARGKNIETRLREEAIIPEDKVITQVIRLDYANPDTLKKLFAPLISKSSVIVSYAPTAMLIVTDVLSNIKRLLSIIKIVDVVGIGEEISLIPLEHATASVIIKTLTTIFQTGKTRVRKKGAAAMAPAIKIVADERTNSLIISASEHDTVKIRELIQLLDQEIPRGTGDIHVYYLQNADAEDLSTVLMALPAKGAKRGAKGKAPVISKDVQIVADKATNSLVITANKQDYRAIVEVIQKLDIPRSMVYIEALIMEVKASSGFNVGVEWRAADDMGTFEGRQVGAFGGSVPDPQGTSIIPTSPVLGPGLSMGVLGDAITIGGVVFPSLGAVARAFQSDSDVHILQTPQILTTDNEEAEIKVADNVPYLSKSSGGDTQYNVYEYKDVGVTLKITPQINQEGFVRLKIFQEYSTLAAGTTGDTPSTLKRTADTTVVVKDGQTVVIGGLVGEQITKSMYGVPCLGDIPLLGWLFKSYSKGGTKTNLFVFLTTYIIRNPGQATEIYEERRETMDKVGAGVIKMYERPKPAVPPPEIG